MHLLGSFSMDVSRLCLQGQCMGDQAHFWVASHQDRQRSARAQIIPASRPTLWQHHGHSRGPAASTMPSSDKPVLQEPSVFQMQEADQPEALRALRGLCKPVIALFEHNLRHCSSNRWASHVKLDRPITSRLLPPRSCSFKHSKYS